MVGKITQGGTNTRPRPAGAQPDSAACQAGRDADKDRRSNRLPGRRARLSRLLPALALLVGALSLFAAQAQAQAPDAPTNLAVVGENRELSVTWTLPSQTLTQIELQYKQTSAPDTTGSGNDLSTGWFSQSVGGGATQARVIASAQGNLTNGTSYDVRVRAVNAEGHSAWVRGAATPGLAFNIGFSNPRAEIKEGEQVVLRLEFATGPDLTPELTREMARARGIALPVEWPLVLTHITSEPGDVRLPATIVLGPRTGNLVHVYAAPDADTDDETFMVALGTRPAGLDSGGVTRVEFTIKDDDEPPRQTYRLPPVTNVVANPRSNIALDVSWTAPEGGAGFDDITDFRVRWREQGTSDWKSSDTKQGLSVFSPLPFVAIDLKKGRPYDVEVASIRKEGDELIAISGWASATGTPNESYGGNPIGLNVQVTPGDRQLRLRWTRTPALQGGARPGSYNVQYRTKQRRVLEMITVDDVSRPRYVGNAPVYVCTDRSNDAEGWISHGSTPDNGDTTRVINGLTPGVEYEVRVQHSSQTRNWFYATGTPSGSGGVMCRPTVSVSLSVSPNPVDEGEAVTVTATLSQALPWDVTIPLKLSANRVTDNRGRPNNGLFIPAGSTSASGKIWTPKDSDELDNTFTVAVDSTHMSMPGEVTEAVSPSSFTVTITDSSVSDATRLKALGITIPQ